MLPTPVIFGVFIAINVVAFIVVVHDKQKSVRTSEHYRTPEGVLFFWATLFGAIGVYVAMQLVRHKTKKWYFQIGIPLLIMQNLATAYLIFTSMSQ